MTGVAPETSGKRLELLREALPKTSRIAVLWNPSNPLGSLERKETVIRTIAILKNRGT